MSPSSNLTPRVERVRATSVPSDEVPNQQLGDRALRARSRYLGLCTREVRRRFLATLPEIHRRGLARKYGGIEAYGAKVGGASPAEVRGALALAERLVEFPSIWRLFETGRVGRASILRVPVEFLRIDEMIWARYLEKHSKAEIETIVREERIRRGDLEAPIEEGRLAGTDSVATSFADGRAAVGSAGPGGQGGLPGQVVPGRAAGEVSSQVAAGSASRSGATSGRKARPHRVFVDLSQEEYGRLQVVRMERSKKEGRPVSAGEILREFLRAGYLDTRPAGESPATEAERAALRARAIEAAGRAQGDRVPVDVQRIIRVETKGICQRPTCFQPGEHFHHQRKRGAWKRKLPDWLRDLPRHHPDAVVLLCSTCHTLVHEGRVANPMDPVCEWKLLPAAAPARAGDRRDHKFRLERQMAIDKAA